MFKMTYCEYIETVLRRAAYLSGRLLGFHISFGKKYVGELIKELKDIQTVKEN